MHFMIDFENVFWGCETLRCGASALSAVLIVLCKVLGQAYLDGQFIKLIESIASHKLSVSRTSRRLVGGLLSLLTLQMLLIVTESCKGRETEMEREGCREGIPVSFHFSSSCFSFFLCSPSHEIESTC